MFSVNTDDLQFLFESVGQRVLINDTEERLAILTNPPLSENEERYIHTLERINMGDLVTLDDENYLVITETITSRGNKYKATIRHCNYGLDFSGETTQELLTDADGNPIKDQFGRPVYRTIHGEPVFIPFIVEHKKFSLEAGQLSYTTDEIIITAQDSEVNRQKFETNVEFELMGRSWKVRQQDLTNKGLINVVCMVS